MAAGLQRIALDYVVMMKRQKALEKEHREETRQQPRDSRRYRSDLSECVWHHPQQRQPQHQPADKADRDLQSGVRQAKERGQHPAHQGGEQSQQAVNNQQHGRRGVERIHGATWALRP